MKRNPSIFIALFILFTSFHLQISAQSSVPTTEKAKKFANWHNADLKKDKKNGISTDRAYEELLKGKTATPIIVAVIDGGVDIFHEDLKEIIWSNPKEIDGNGIDDDNNGYIDDMHGWNFIGTGKKGSIIYESLELTREYLRLSNKFDNREFSEIATADTAEYTYFKAIKERFLKEKKDADEMYTIYKRIKEDWDAAELEVKKFMHKDSVTNADIKAMNVPESSRVEYAKNYLLKLIKQGIDKKAINAGFSYFEDKHKYQYNTEFAPRKAVGDDPDNFKDTKYGNNDVKGSRPFHGTFVAGIIAAKRDNGIGMNGIADNVQIMPILVVPDGDERDKDIALAIRYATDNGAKIINMSFGKEFSPNKKQVLEAMEYAAEHNVLLVHAAGNESLSNDTIMHYPSAYMTKSNRAIASFIEVGASTMYKGKKIPADFSNYGATTVDIFAPGEDIYSTNPESTYDVASGTSFSCPVVAGAAALIWSHYPKLTAKEVKEILIASGVSFASKTVKRPIDGGQKAPKIKFGQLCISGKIINVYAALKLAESYKN